MVQLRVSLEALVAQAWRDRWTELEWGERLRLALSQDASELHALPRLLIKQATLSEVPNKLMFNYLSYTLAAQVIPHTALLEAVIDYKDLSRDLCVQALLDLLNFVRDSLRCDSSDAYACDRLAALVTSTLSWLARAGQSALATRKQDTLTDLITVSLALVHNPFAALCVHFDQIGNQDAFKELTSALAALQQASDASEWLSDGVKIELRTYVQKVNSVPALLTRPMAPMLDPRELNPSSSHPAALTLAAVYGACRLSAHHDRIAADLKSLRTALALPWWLAVKDFVRGAFLLLLDPAAAGAPVRAETNMVAFVFLKVPRVLARLLEGGAECTGNDVQRALEQVVRYSSLLNSLDLAAKCNSFQSFLEQLKSFNVLTEVTAAALATLRNGERAAAGEDVTANMATNSGINLVIKASSTVQTLEKSFNDKFASIKSEKIVQMMAHITGKSFEVISASTAAMSKLNGFAKKLIEFNELSARPPVADQGDAAVSSDDHQRRAIMFDLSLLLLSRIRTLYTDLDTSECSESFFARFRHAYGIDSQTTPIDPSEVPGATVVNDDYLMKLINQQHGAYNVDTCDWGEFCWSVPKVGRLLLSKLESAAVSAADVKSVCAALQRDLVPVPDPVKSPVKCQMSCKVSKVLVWECPQRASLLLLVEWLHAAQIGEGRTPAQVDGELLDKHRKRAAARRLLAMTIQDYVAVEMAAAAQLPPDRRPHSHVERYNFAATAIRPLLEATLTHLAAAGIDGGNTPLRPAPPPYNWLIHCGRRTVPRLGPADAPGADHLKQAFSYSLRQAAASPSILMLLARCGQRAGDPTLWCQVWAEEMMHLVTVDTMSLAAELCLGVALLESSVECLMRLCKRVIDYALGADHELSCVAPRGLVLARFLVQAYLLAVELETQQRHQGKQRVVRDDQPAGTSTGGGYQRDAADGSGQPKTKMRRLSAADDGKSRYVLPPGSQVRASLQWFYAQLWSWCERGDIRPSVYLAASVLRALADFDGPAAKIVVDLMPPYLNAPKKCCITLAQLQRIIRIDANIIGAPTVLALHDLADGRQRQRALQSLCLLRQLKAL